MTPRRFQARISPCPITGCWWWTGSVNAYGYGRIFSRRDDGGYREEVGAHRVSWEVANGPIPDGLWVLHRCDNPICVNPAHLFVGTALDNNRDRSAKGRYSRAPRWHPSGERNPAAKLTAERAAAVRREYVPGVVTLDDVAQRFGISRSQVRNIVAGRSWREASC